MSNDTNCTNLKNKMSCQKVHWSMCEVYLEYWPMHGLTHHLVYKLGYLSWYVHVIIFFSSNWFIRKSCIFYLAKVYTTKVYQSCVRKLMLDYLDLFSQIGWPLLFCLIPLNSLFAPLKLLLLTNKKSTPQLLIQFSC